MAVKAFILINTEMGMAASVTKALRGLDLVLSADAVAGSHDVIAVVEGPDLAAIGDFVTGQVHATKGLTHTVTCPALGNP